MAQSKRLEEVRPPSAANQDGLRAGYAGVLHELVTSSPAWLRGLTLIAVTLSGLTVVTVVCAAVLAGREVTFWPPRVSGLEPCQVTNCKAVLAALPAIRAPEEQEVGRLGGIIKSQMEEMKKLQTQSSTGVNTIYIDSAFRTLKGETDDLNKRLDGALKILQDRADSVVKSCLSLVPDKGAR